MTQIRDEIFEDQATKLESRKTNLTVSRELSVAWAFCAAFAVFPFATATALLSKFIASKYLPSQTLSDFRVGSLALYGQTKTGEVLVPFFLYGIVLVVSIFIYIQHRSNSLSKTAQNFLITEAILASPAMLPFVLGNGGSLLDFVDSTFLLVFIIQMPPAIFLFVLKKSRRPLRNRFETLDDLVLRFWFLAALPISSMGLTVAVHYKLAPQMYGLILWLVPLMILGLLFAFVLAGIIPKILVRSFNIANLGFSLLGILALPLLLPPLLNSGGRSFPVMDLNPIAWKVLFAVSTVMILLEALIRRSKSGERNLVSAIPSFAIAALLVPLRGIYGVPAISSDDYHFGEIFSPGFLMTEYNQIPYTEIILPRGFLVNVAPSIFNNLFFEGTAATSSYVYLIIAFVVVGVSHLLLRNVVGFTNATIMVAFVSVANRYLEGDLLVTALLLFTFGLILRQARSLVLGTALALLSSIAILAYPLMGVAAFAVVFLVLMIGGLGELLGRADGFKYVFSFFSVFLGAIGLVLVSPAGKPVIAAVEYVLVNFGSNTESFGVSIDLTFGTPFALGQILSMSFVIGAFISAWILWTLRKSLRTPSWSIYSALMIALAPGLFSLGLFGRYMGRIDPAEWLYRSAAGSIVVIGIITPAVLLILDKPSFTKASRVLFVFALIISLSIAPMGRGGLIRSSMALVESTSQQSTHTAALTIPSLGHGNSDGNHVASLVAIKAIAANLDSGESVLNLSNRGALFKYMKWRNPIKYLAPYNIPSSVQELEIVRQLSIDPPRIAFIGPGPQHDGLSLSLRNPILTNWIVANYTPLRCGDTTWALLNSRHSSNQLAALNCPLADSNKVLTSTQIWASSIGAPAYLMNIPSSWGSRATPSRVNSKEIHVYAGVRTNETQSFILAVPGDDMQSQLLEISSSCPLEIRKPLNSANYTAQVKWGPQDNVEPFYNSTFDWRANNLIVPMDAYPTWMADLSATKFIRLTIPSVDCQSGWKIVAQMRSR